MIRRLAVTGAVAVMVALPFVADTYTTAVGARILALGLMAVAVHLLSTRTLQASLGHGAYFGVGGYTTALLAKAGHDSAPLQLAAAVTAAVAAAAVIAVALARLRGLTYVLASLAVGMLAAAYAASAHAVTGGTDGIAVPAPDLWPFGISLAPTGIRYLWLATVVLGICGLLAWHTRSPFAAAALAIGDIDQRMNALGYPVTRTVWRAHLHSAAVAGAAGALWVHATGYLNPTDLGLTTSALALAAATIGHRHGPIVVITATAALVGARDVAASHLPPAGQGPLWLGLLLLTAAFLPLASRRTTPTPAEVRP
ncbi:branched-chain amino acid ABC transporter permease [Catellatospora methionotrophica]|uniref:branched-chain amino acid ABC transporter permease n=1 Tax=Catellatospora methionotrophica TaxID=121620 RepID=UPI0034036395